MSNIGLGEILFTKKNLDSEQHCGVVNPSYFKVNVPHFFESKNYNTCLNRKIGIDKKGLIKNCPSMSEHFGHIDSTHLSTVVTNKTFTKIWEVTKDQIEICKSCEFRHICTDCRAYISNNQNSLSKPFKCSYNPFTTIWANDVVSSLQSTKTEVN